MQILHNHIAAEDQSIIDGYDLTVHSIEQPAAQRDHRLAAILNLSC
jgi:hypothetical protein